MDGLSVRSVALPDIVVDRGHASGANVIWCIRHAFPGGVPCSKGSEHGVLYGDRKVYVQENSVEEAKIMNASLRRKDGEAASWSAFMEDYEGDRKDSLFTSKSNKADIVFKKALESRYGPVEEVTYNVSIVVGGFGYSFILETDVDVKESSLSIMNGLL